jgi:hypothetical protein
MRDRGRRRPSIVVTTKVVSTGSPCTVMLRSPRKAEGRLRLCNLIEDGRSLAAVAESVWISRQTAHKWCQRRGWPVPGTAPVAANPEEA